MAAGLTADQAEWTARFTGLPVSAGTATGGDAPGGGFFDMIANAPDLAKRALDLYGLAKKIKSSGEELTSAGRHWIGRNDPNLIAAGHAMNDCASTIGDIAKQYEDLSGNDKLKLSDRIDKVTDGVDKLLKAADFVLAMEDADQATRDLSDSASRAHVDAWADSVVGVFDKAGGLLDLIPGDAVPGFMTDYWKALFQAPRTVIGAFRKIMKDHYDRIDQAVDMPDPDGTQIQERGGGTVWKGELSKIFLGGYHQPKLADGTEFQTFMKDHRDEGGLDLYKAPLEAGRTALLERIDANVDGGDETKAKWMDYVTNA